MKPNNFFTERLTRQAAGDPPPAPNPTDDPPPADAPIDLSFIPQDFHTDGKPDVGKFTAHYQDIVARDAQMSERLAQVPEAYDFALSPDLKFEGLDLPDDFTVELAKDDPALAPLFEELGGFLKEVGAPAAAASKVSDLIAKYEAVKFSQSFAARKAELAALGTPVQAQARLAAVERTLQARLPETQASALKAAAMTAEGVKALEALLRPAGHTAPVTQPTKADTENLSPYDRLKYANTRA